MNKKDKIILGIGIVCALIFLKTCQQSSSSLEQKEPTVNANFSETTLNVDNNPTIQKWEYNEDENVMDDAKKYYAEITADDKLYFKFPYDGGISASIMLRYSEGKNEVMFRITKGQFMPNSFDTRMIRVRFDNLKPERYSYTEPSDGSSTTIFIQGARKFISRLKKSKKTVIECEFYNEGINTIKFNTCDLIWKH